MAARGLPRAAPEDPGHGLALYVDGAHHPCPIEGGGTVDDIVRDPAHHYVAAIGGDIHNYQRYPVRLDDGRTLQYVVAGGGGAFTHATHTIPGWTSPVSRSGTSAAIRCAATPWPSTARSTGAG
ncbi:hypothetical protein SHKM778_41140 [Streptomyces sp. KM77-8]|uniref:Uncharacterized protein n=1 Tax=Streptomyces haneummycinicus TaxID=3074435 RepID=A0AAT9HJN8_9ACTN